MKYKSLLLHTCCCIVFGVFGFKFMFEFICLIVFLKKRKNISFSSSSPSPLLAHFDFEPRTAEVRPCSFDLGSETDQGKDPTPSQPPARVWPQARTPRRPPSAYLKAPTQPRRPLDTQTLASCATPRRRAKPSRAAVGRRY
jgi:hypothetical protein